MFSIGDLVWYRNGAAKKEWGVGVVTGVIFGPKSGVTYYHVRWQQPENLSAVRLLRKNYYTHELAKVKLPKQQGKRRK